MDESKITLSQALEIIYVPEEEKYINVGFEFVENYIYA